MPHKVRKLAISYLRYYKSGFDTVKSKVGLLDEYISTSYKFIAMSIEYNQRWHCTYGGRAIDEAQHRNHDTQPITEQLQGTGEKCGPY